MKSLCRILLPSVPMRVFLIHLQCAAKTCDMHFFSSRSLDIVDLCFQQINISDFTACVESPFLYDSDIEVVVEDHDDEDPFEHGFACG